MNRQRPLLLLILVVYIFSPTLFSWIINPAGAWYRPFIVWLIVIIIAYFVQKNGNRIHDL